MTTMPARPRFDEPDLASDLIPVINALREEAARRAQVVSDETDASINEMLNEAREESKRLLASARAEGSRAARRLASSLVADARHEAREEVLHARLQIYESARSAALSQLGERAHSSEALALRSRLGELAREQLGPDSAIKDADDGIGIIAELGPKRIDLSGAVLVNHEIALMGDVIEGLWL